MFGLEKKQRALFEFDLEKELKDNPTKKQTLSKAVEEKIQEIKTVLRQGAASEDFDQYGILLHGFAALQKVLNKMPAKK
jgi:hypothetical protein